MKKLLAPLFIIALIFAITISAMAAEPTVSASMGGSGSARNITVTVADDYGIYSQLFAFINGTSSDIYTITGELSIYTVHIDFSGNSISPPNNQRITAAEPRTSCNEQSGHFYGIIVDGFIPNGVVTAPTCETAGYTTYACLRCGEEETNLNENDFVNALGHTKGEKVTTLVPTCTDKGAWEICCTVCETKLAGRGIPALGHTPGEKVTTLEPTCTEEGAWEIRCDVCDDLLDFDAIEALGHEPGEKTTTLVPTCTGDGEWEIKCDICDDVLESGALEALGHEPGEKITTLAPTCTEAGAWEIQCDVCGELIENGIIPANGHDYEITAVVPMTPKSDGYTTYTCTVCGDSYNDDFEYAVPYNWVIDEVVEPTCTARGYTIYKDEYWNKTKTSDWTKPLGHAPGEKATTLEPTCTEVGAWEIRCVRCSDIVLESGSIPATGHLILPGSEPTTTIDPDCVSRGQKLWECGNGCGHVYYREFIDALGHDFVPSARNAGIFKRGDGSMNVEYVCSRCPEYFVWLKVDTLLSAIDLTNDFLNGDFDGYTAESVEAAKNWVNVDLGELEEIRNPMNPDSILNKYHSDAALKSLIDSINISASIEYAKKLLVEIPKVIVDGAPRPVVLTTLGKNVTKVNIEIRQYFTNGSYEIIDIILLTNSGGEGSKTVDVKSANGITYSITRNKSQDGNNGITAITKIVKK